VGGQGVLFVTRLLADAAIRGGKRVLSSETHGMAQRGGVVVSHLKVGGFESPLVRTSHADGLLVLRAENLDLHRPFLAPGGWVVVNSSAPPPEAAGSLHHVLDADAMAVSSGNPQSANLILLGFALTRLGSREEGGLLFCSATEVRTALSSRLADKEELLSASLAALELGLSRGRM
jgi:indolepyruvate ferredoxin oxidoreductase beta subunit